MTLLARLLLLIAAFAYGAMPFTGMSAMAMPMMPMPPAAHSSVPALLVGEMAVMVHHGSPAAYLGVRSSADCPHASSSSNETDTSQGPMPGWHCSACLMLPVAFAIADGGPPARAAEAAALPQPLLSRMTAPLTPPPRA